MLESQKKSNAQSVSDYRRNRKLNLIKVAGGKCVLCGYSKNPSALEFHHLHPEDKSYGLATKGTCHNIQQDLAEVKKCILICANCHRDVTDGFYTVQELEDKFFFDEEFAKTLIPLTKEERAAREYFCSECGIKISKDASTGKCPTCAMKARRKVSRPNREELKNLIRTTSFVQIGNLYGVSDNAVRKWCEAYHLPKNVSIIKQYTNAEWEAL